MPVILLALFTPLSEVERLPPRAFIAQGISFNYACDERLEVMAIMEPWREDIRQGRRALRCYRDSWQLALDARSEWMSPWDRRMALVRFRQTLHPLDWAERTFPPFVPWEYFREPD